MKGLKLSSLKRIFSYTIKSTSAWGDSLIFILFILVFAVARFLGILVHELGHGLLALALGGDFYALYASPGTGLAYIYLEDLSWGERVFVDAGGVMFQLIIGVLLFISYPKFKSFLARIFSLQLLVVLIIYPLLYLGLSVFYGGDGAAMVGEIKRNAGLDASLPLTALSLFFASFVAYFILRRILAFLEDYFTLFTEKEAFHTLFLFFSLPLIIGFIGAILAISAIPLAYIQFLIAFLMVAHLIFYFEAYFITKKRKSMKEEKRKIRAISGKESNTVILSFAIMAVLWLASFGPTPSTAHGLILKEPPIEAEKYFADNADRMALNANVKISPDELEVEIIARGVMSQPSPLEYRMWRSYDDRAHWSYYENVSKYILLRMLKITDWHITSKTFGTEVYGYGTTYRYPRVLKFSTTSFEEAFVNSSGTYTLTLYDPWLVEKIKPTNNYLARLNISWSAEFQLTNYSSEPHRGARSDLLTFLEWKNENRDVAPIIYSAEFIRV